MHQVCLHVLYLLIVRVYIGRCALVNEMGNELGDSLENGTGELPSGNISGGKELRQLPKKYHEVLVRVLVIRGIISIGFGIWILVKGDFVRDGIITLVSAILSITCGVLGFLLSKKLHSSALKALYYVSAVILIGLSVTSMGLALQVGLGRSKGLVANFVVTLIQTIALVVDLGLLLAPQAYKES